MYSPPPGGNPWDIRGAYSQAGVDYTGQNEPFISGGGLVEAMAAGVSHDGSCQDDPRPLPGMSKSELISLLCVETFRRIERMLHENEASFGEEGELLPPAGEEGEAVVADIDLQAFNRFTAFPDTGFEEDVSLASKLALATPAHPEVLQESLAEITMAEGDSEKTSSRIVKIALHWLRESFGDDSLPKPGEQKDGCTRRMSVNGAPAPDNSNGPQSTVGAGASPFHCNACEKPMTLQSFRVRCAECEDFDLCESCFCQGKEVQSHKREHYYTPIGPSQFPLFDPNWAADEELSLVDAVGKFGFGNWNDVADYVASMTPINLPVKEKEHCERRYFEFHLRAPESERDAWPFTSMIQKPAYTGWQSFLNDLRECIPTEEAKSSKDVNLGAQSGSTPASRPVAELRPCDPTLLAPSNRVKLKHTLVQPPISLPPKVQILGYLQQRGDFEVEFDNSAELLIADLEIRDDESPMEKDAKLKSIEAYNVTLDQRARRKRMMLERKIYDQKLQSAIDRLRTPEQKVVHELLKPLSKYFYPAWSEDKAPLFTNDRKTRPAEGLLTEQELEEIVELILEDRKLVERLQLLTAWREAGLRTVKEILEDGEKVLERVNAEQVKQRKRADVAAEKIDMEAAFCAELELKEGFFKVIKDLLAQKTSPIAFDSLGYKLLEIDKIPEAGVSVNDFVVQAKIEAFTTEAAKHSSTASSLTEMNLQVGQKSEPSSVVGDYRQASHLGSEASPRLTSELDVETSRAGSATTSPPQCSLAFPSSPAQSEEAEEGEIDGDDEDEETIAPLMLKGGGKSRQAADGGKGEKQTRRASGGLAPLNFNF